MVKGNKGKNPAARRNRQKRRATPNVGVHLFGAGAENFMVHTRVFVEPTAVQGTNLKCGVLTVNPVTILSASFSAPLATMFALFRVNSISFRAFFANTSANTVGIHYSVLTLDTSFAPVANNNFTEWIYSQPRMRTGRMNTIHSHKWQPIEPSDYNYEPFSGNTADFGRLYFAGDSPANDLGVYYIEIDMSLSLLNRRAPTGFFDNLRSRDPAPPAPEDNGEPQWPQDLNFEILA